MVLEHSKYLFGADFKSLLYLADVYIAQFFVSWMLPG